MNETQQKGRILADGMNALFLAGQLAAGEDDKKRWTDAEMKNASVVNLFFNPLVKETLRATAFMVGEDMTNFCKKAVLERLRRIHDEKKAAMNALDAQKGGVA